MKRSVVALFSVNLMYSVNHMSVKVMLHCISKIANYNTSWIITHFNQEIPFGYEIEKQSEYMVALTQRLFVVWKSRLK